MWIPRITYNPFDTGTVFTFSLPQGLWGQSSKKIGGADESASGIKASYEIRQDRKATTTLRFTDAEFDAVMSMLEFLQRGGIFRFAFNKDLAPLYQYDVRLDEPTFDDDVAPTRDDYGAVWEQAITFRTANGSRIAVPFYEGA